MALEAIGIFFFLIFIFLILKNSIKPYITGHYDRLSDVKKRAFLETIKSQDHLMKIIDLILSQLSYYKETQKKDAYHSLPVDITAEKIVRCHFQLMPKEKVKDHVFSRSAKAREEELLCMLISYLVQSFVLKMRRSLSTKDREMLKRAGELWVKRREKKAHRNCALFSYLHRTSSSLSLLE